MPINWISFAILSYHPIKIHRSSYINNQLSGTIELYAGANVRDAEAANHACCKLAACKLGKSVSWSPELTVLKFIHCNGQDFSKPCLMLIEITAMRVSKSNMAPNGNTPVIMVIAPRLRWGGTLALADHVLASGGIGT